MSTMAEALTAPQLTPFEGKDVAKATIAIRKAGDGLSEAMKFNALGEAEFHHGQEVYVVLKCQVTDVQFPPIKDTNMLARKHIFTAIEATMVDAKVVKKQLDQQAERIRTAREEADGILHLKGTRDAAGDSDGDGDE